MKLFFWQWTAEMKKMLARKRTFLGFGAFILLEILLYIFFHLEKVEKGFRAMIQHQGEAFESYFSALTLAYMVLGLSIFLLGGIYLTLVAGDVVAKESEDGNLRLILTRPISRFRLLAIKYLCCVVYTIALVQFIAWSALALGVLVRGWGGGLFVFLPQPNLAFFDADEGLQRYALVTIVQSLSMLTATSIAFFLSCLRIKPSAATITALSYLFIDSVLREIPAMDSYKYLLVTHYMSYWAAIFQDPIPWANMVHQYTILGGICLTLFVMGWIVFEARDIKS